MPGFVRTEKIVNPMSDPEYKKKIDAIDVKIKRQKLAQQGVPTLPTKDEKVKAKQELDDLSKALKVLKQSIEILDKAEKESDPASMFTPEETEKIKPWLDKGFSHHEAAHMTGIRSTPYSLKSTRKSNEMSDAMLEHAKKYAANHVQKLKEIRGESAESHHNPVIFEHHQSGKVTKDLAKDLNQHLSDFKASGALDGMLPHQKAAAIQKKTAEWHALNKEQEKQKASETAKQLNEIHDHAAAARQFELLQQRMHMLSGGSGSTESPDYDALPEDLDYSQEDEDKI
jgi:hypothetical protein